MLFVALEDTGLQDVNRSEPLTVKVALLETFS